MERRTFLKLAALVPGLALAGCGGSKTLLSPKDPTMLSIWHVYGEQADSPMNRLLTEFNDTVGREKGILLNVTNMTNSAAIGGQLQDAKAAMSSAVNQSFQSTRFSMPRALASAEWAENRSGRSSAPGLPALASCSWPPMAALLVMLVTLSRMPFSLPTVSLNSVSRRFMGESACSPYTCQMLSMVGSPVWLLRAAAAARPCFLPRTPPCSASGMYMANRQTRP